MVKPATCEDVEYVAMRMRACDAKEICALADTTSPLIAVSPLYVLRHIGVTVWSGAEPAVAIGAMFMHPGVASVFMFATDRWRERQVRGETARYVRRGLVPTLLAHGIHRMQAPALAENVDSHKWMARFGAKPESTMKAYGKSKQDFIMFVMDEAAMTAVVK